MKNFKFLLLSIVVLSCGTDSHQNLSWEAYHKLSDEEKRSPEYATEGIDLLDDELEITLFASEPMMINPTNMDIDDKGRVWICEAFNYRNFRNPRNPYKEQGDRILIMEDTDGDGKADKSKVFYQGEDINAALGIAVMGNKVIVSVSPNVFVFTDEDGDDVADKKEVLFTGVGGEQHDHGMHAFTFGPDGKFYFNYGNAGKGILTHNGEAIKDDLGREINGKGEPYREGMVFRCDTDGSNVEILAWNFRNNYEVAVDSYGRMWQSDNDDDGNRSTRINYVMDYGNYGFKDEITGSDWRARRVNMEDSVYHQHWHLNDPGVVPNLLQTYAGSPTGITVYEGDLLPKKYQGQIIHCDAGPNVLRAYPVEQDGAGFKSEIIKILDGNSRDNWFRPSDVTVAPDGSIFVADWYDPGVGGHAMGDTTRGRIYRIAPKGHKYTSVSKDYNTIDGAILALQSPNTATRFKAYQSLQKMGNRAEEALAKLFNGNDQRMAARAFWLLSKLTNGKKWINEALSSSNENMRVAAVRSLRLEETMDSELLLRLSKDSSAQVRREVAFAIRHKDFNEVWLSLANQYQAGDRWYLEALGIAADQKWNELLPAFVSQKGKDWIKDLAARDIVWRSRSEHTTTYLAQLIKEDKRQQLRYYRALDFQQENKKMDFLNTRMGETDDEDELIVILRQISVNSVKENPARLKLLNSLVNKINDDQDFLDVVRKFEVKSQKDRLLHLIDTHKSSKIVFQAAAAFTHLYGIDEVKSLCFVEDELLALRRIEGFGYVDEEPVTDILVSIFSDNSKAENIRQQAMAAMNGQESEKVLWELVIQNKVPNLVMPKAKDLLMRTWNGEIRELATKFFADDKVAQKDLVNLLAMTANVDAGQKVFNTFCTSCHMINGKGVDFGPGLSQIGSKLSKSGLFNSIINPSEGMGFGYETKLIKFKDGNEVMCIVTSETENEIFVKLVGQADQTAYSVKDILSIEEMEQSLMPKYPLKDEELVNLVGYLETLK